MHHWPSIGRFTGPVAYLIWYQLRKVCSVTKKTSNNGIDIMRNTPLEHDHVIKWNHLPGFRPFVRGVHRWALNSHHKGQWRGALTFYFIIAWTNFWAKHRSAGDLRHHGAYYGVNVMINCNTFPSVMKCTFTHNISPYIHQSITHDIYK